jgi:hypothetical protein
MWGVKRTAALRPSGNNESPAIVRLYTGWVVGLPAVRRNAVQSGDCMRACGRMGTAMGENRLGIHLHQV